MSVFLEMHIKFKTLKPFNLPSISLQTCRQVAPSPNANTQWVQGVHLHLSSLALCCAFLSHSCINSSQIIFVLAVELISSWQQQTNGQTEGQTDRQRQGTANAQREATGSCSNTHPHMRGGTGTECVGVGLSAL